MIRYTSHLAYYELNETQRSEEKGMRKEGGRRTKIKIPLDFPRVLRNEF